MNMCLEAHVERINKPVCHLHGKRRLSARLSIVCPIDSRNFVLHGGDYLLVKDPAIFTTKK